MHAQSLESNFPRRLHLAVASSAPVDVVTELIIAYADGVSCTDSAGRMPLHIATANGASCAVIAALLTVFSGALYECDKSAQYPDLSQYEIGKLVLAIRSATGARRRAAMIGWIRGWA